jgi:PAS domain S-box-containing protein
MQAGHQYPVFLLVVIIATFLGGVLVGLAAVALSALTAGFFDFILPTSFSAIETGHVHSATGHVYGMISFIVVGILTVFIISSLQRAVLAIEHAHLRAAVLEERAQAADALRRWMDVFENVAFGISVVDPKSNTISFANQAFATLHGMSSDRVHGMSMFDLFRPDERERIVTVANTADREGSAHFEADRCRQDGSTFPARMHVTSVRRADGEVVYRIVSVLDISSQRELEAELHQAQRLEAVGQLTAGIAHDFNNLLQGIMANLELLDDEIQDRPAARQLLGTVLRIAEHGGNLTRHLLSFARQQLLRPGALDLGAFLGEFRGTLSRTLDPRIRIKTVAEPGLAPVWVDPAHLHTALLNLAINARDAMPSGGELQIEACSSSAAGAGGPEGAGVDRMAVILVSDTGTGIAPEILAKVCDPFFTTKGSRGTGLGLSMVYGFAKQSGGDLHIASEPGKGTCVQLWLPLAPMRADVPT